MESPSSGLEVKRCLDPLERRVLTHLLKLKLKGEFWVIAVSGGLDSVVLAHVLWRIARFGDWKLRICYVHHGSGDDDVQSEYRDRAQAHVESLGQRWGLPVEVRRASAFLESEAEARRFRRSEFQKILDEQGAARVVQGHHRDDLLETRLIRLIRGTGPQGLQSMRAISGIHLRPFLRENRKELLAYAQRCDLKWEDDPSNSDSRYLRNWIRKDWLPGLERVRPGSVECFAESLDLILRELESAKAGSSRMGLPVDVPLTDVQGEVRWSRAAFSTLTPFEQSQLIARAYQRLEAKGFSRRHVSEVLKRLASTRRRVEFRVGGLEFDMSSEQVVCRRISPRPGHAEPHC